MICPTCHGTGIRRRTVPHWAFLKPGQIPRVIEEPCPHCIGGIASCCDAAGSAQPESAKREENNGPA